MNKNHNKTSIEAYYDEDGRVKISPEVMKLLKPKLIDDKYYPHTIKDRHLLGFRAIAHKGGQRSSFTDTDQKERRKRQTFRSFNYLSW